MAAKKRRKLRTTRRVKTQGGGLASQVAGAAQDVYGQAAGATRNGALKLDQWSRNAIRTQPYTSALTVFGAGLLLGEMGALLGGKTHGINGFLGRNSEPRASVVLRVLAAALVDIGAPGR